MRLCKEHHYFRSQKTVLECPPIPPNSKSLLGWHPHGILCVGWILNGNVGEQLFNSEFRWLTAPVLFKLPLLSEMLTWYNCAPSSAQSMKTRMKTGENIALIPGGFQEATTYQYGKHRAYLTRRKGFIKYALQHGYRVYPVWTFGEERTYYSVAVSKRREGSRAAVSLSECLGFRCGHHIYAGLFLSLEMSGDEEAPSVAEQVSHPNCHFYREVSYDALQKRKASRTAPSRCFRPRPRGCQFDCLLVWQTQ
mmetsp:Transcript_25758/g.45879  ORF Transcript_25758/g.45879 Transcript_25758/m.45879 type:complete len:251 (-) Transcript_25758:539-1291(-)